MIVLCPYCARVLERPPDQAFDVASHHEEQQHQGHEVVRLYRNQVSADKVDELIDDVQDDLTRQQYGELVDLLVNDHRFKTEDS